VRSGSAVSPQEILVTEIKVMLGLMSAMLGEALIHVIEAQPDMRVVGSFSGPTDMIRDMRAAGADVLITQGGAPELAALVAGASLGLLLIDDSGQSGQVARVAIEQESLAELSHERVIAAVRAAARRDC
jgi:hypothetical protein